MPFSVNGKLTGGKFYVDGGISSQFITGLLFALPLLEEDSEIILTSHLESKPYVDITLGTLREHGCHVEETERGYFVKGGQHYMPFSGRVEGIILRRLSSRWQILWAVILISQGFLKNLFREIKKLLKYAIK